MIVWKKENAFFHKHYLKMDISLDISCKALKFETSVYGIWMQETISQNFDLGPSFHFYEI